MSVYRGRYVHVRQFHSGTESETRTQSRVASRANTRAVAWRPGACDALIRLCG
jgi:hypothetical protein